MIKRILLFFLSLFVGIGLLIWVINFVGWQNIESAFLIFAGWHGLVILILTGLMIFFGLWKWQVILRGQGHNLPLKKLSGTYLASFSLIYFFPMVIFGGEIFRSYILKDKFSIPWKKGVTSVIIDRILEITFILLAIFAGLIFFLLKIGFPPKKMGIILAVSLFFISALVGFFYFKVFKKESIVKILARLFNHKKFLDVEILEAEEEIFSFFKLGRKALFQASLLAFLKIIISWLRCWLLILFLGENIGLLPALSILGFYYFAFLIPIPTALGSHELIQTFAFSAMGLKVGSAPVFTMIQRGTELVWALAGLALFFVLGICLIQKIVCRKAKCLTNDKGDIMKT